MYSNCECNERHFPKVCPAPETLKVQIILREISYQTLRLPPDWETPLKCLATTKKLKLYRDSNYKFFFFFLFSLSSSEKEENKRNSRRIQGGEERNYTSARLKVYFLPNGRTFLFFGERNSRLDPLPSVAASTPWISASPLDERPWSRRQLTYCEPSGKIMHESYATLMTNMNLNHVLLLDTINARAGVKYSEAALFRLLRQFGRASSFSWLLWSNFTSGQFTQERYSS